MILCLKNFRMVKISEDLRKLVVRKMLDGQTQVNVAKDLNIGRTTVRYIFQKYMKTGKIVDAKRNGRPLKTTERERRLLCRTSKMNPFWTAREVWNASRSMPNVSLTTVKRYLRQNNLLGRVAARKPLLNALQIKRRIKWCKAYLAFGAPQWNKVIFSDECRIERHSSRRTFVRRPINSRFDYRYVLKTVKYGGYSVLVWGLIKADGTRMLIRCPHILNSVEYQTVLRNGLIRVYNSDEIFVQDGAPCHRSASTQQYLETKNVCVLSDWPPQSPDLNIIEHMWAILKARVAKRYCSNSGELWSIVKEEWDRIPMETVQKLYMSIPRRLKHTLANKGLHSHY